MASIGREGKIGERKRIVYRDEAGRQQSLRLGKCSEQAARTALAGMERLLESDRLNSTLHPDAVRWLEGINDVIHARVVGLGLAQPRKRAEKITVGGLLERFEAASSVKPATKAAYRQTFESLRGFLGASTPIADVTAVHADNWRKSIAEPVTVKTDDGEKVAKRLAAATVAKRVFVARAVFKRAVRWGLIRENPFGHLRAGSQSNPDRAYYVPSVDVQAILAVCPDTQWRAIIGLSRYAGLRCPSEITSLRWGDVDRERGRLTVRSAKTEAHEGHAVRIVPIAPELEPILQDLYDQAEEGAEPVVPRLRDPKVNLRTQFERIIARASLKPWPRLFHAMRASCACDWVERFPGHVVASWLGHSPLIAARHYLQTRDVHFDLAAGRQQAASNPATDARPEAPRLHEPKSENAENQAPLVMCRMSSGPLENEKVGEEGFEPP